MPIATLDEPEALASGNRGQPQPDPLWVAHRTEMFKGAEPRHLGRVRSVIVGQAEATDD